MENLKVCENGQLTIPSEIVAEMGIDKGTEFYFLKIDYYFILIPTTLNLFEEIQMICDDLAKRAGCKTEEDTIAYINEAKKEIYRINKIVNLSS